MTTNGTDQKVLPEPDRVALLIDTDNASPAYRHEVEEVARKYGEIVGCLGFGVRPNRLWQKDEALPMLEWCGESSLTNGKNATDIVLAVAAADLRHTTRIDCFCIVSGDSDFVGLARYLRAAGKKVVGIGEKRKTAQAFREACNVFEVLGRRKSKKTGPSSASPAERSIGPHGDTTMKSDAKGAGSSVKLVEDIQCRGTGNGSTPTDRARFLELVHEVVGNGKPKWRRISWLGDRLRRLQPEFRCSTYGMSKLGALLETFPDQFETRGKRGPIEFRLLERFSPEDRGVK